MGKVNSHSKEKIWENKRFKVKGLLNFSFEAVIQAVPKTWEKRISIVWEKHGKTQTFESYAFLNYFG